jgi:hypothetical protein
MLGDLYSYYLKPCEFVNILKISDSNLKESLLTGVILTDNTINKGVLIDLIRYYLVLNDCYLYNNNIYKKIEGTKVSYKFVGSVAEILYNDFMQNVVNFFIINYNDYFIGFDFSKLVKDYLIVEEKVIKAIYKITTNRINPDFSLIEFNDGVYSIKYDRFFPNNKDYNFSSKISTIKYYNESYE